MSLRLPKGIFHKAEQGSLACSAALSFESSDSHWIVTCLLGESKNHDRFAEEDGSGWMHRLTPLRDGTLQLSTWLDTWQTTDMQDVLKTVALGRGQEAECRVRSHYAAWLKAQRPASSGAARRQVAQLRELAKSAAVTRRAREVLAHAKREEERRRKREGELRRIMASPEEYWKAASEQASRGSASGHEKAVSLLKVLAEGYALLISQDAFDRQLRRFLVPYATRAALLRRLTEAGVVWVTCRR